jgi:hypothetical protein
LRNSWKFRAAALAALTFVSLSAQWTSAQERMSDNDVENTMKNLKEDSRRFQSSFNSAISKSSIRKTSLEKDDKALVKSFQAQTETMLKYFQDHKKAETTLPGVLSMAKQIDAIFASASLGGSAPSD